jgi:hypothetical protein
VFSASKGPAVSSSANIFLSLVIIFSPLLVMLKLKKKMYPDKLKDEEKIQLLTGDQ